VAGFSLVSDDVLQAANAVSRISSLDDKFNAKQF
jgi:hypothetical protein